MSWARSTGAARRESARESAASASRRCSRTRRRRRASPWLRPERGGPGGRDRPSARARAASPRSRRPSSARTGLGRLRRSRAEARTSRIAASGLSGCPAAGPFAPSARASARGWPWWAWHPACTRITPMRMRCLGIVLGLGLAAPGGPAFAAGWTLVGWNNLGMHCMDDDYSVFSILPPYNTIDAQLIDPDGTARRRRRRASARHLRGRRRPDRIDQHDLDRQDELLERRRAISSASRSRPTRASPASTCRAQRTRRSRCASTRPQRGSAAEGIPITPFDDAGAANTYPMMRLTARDAAGTVLATTDVVLPVSERDGLPRLPRLGCGRCGARRRAAGSTTPTRARLPAEHPAAPRRAARRHPRATQAALDAAGYDPAGLYAHRARRRNEPSSARAATPRTRCPAPRLAGVGAAHARRCTRCTRP